MPFLDDHRWYEINSAAESSPEKTPAVFLDRDGVIISEKHYIRHPDDVEILPGVADKLAEIRSLKLSTIVVTNQSGIGRGLLAWDDYERVHLRIRELLSMAQPFDAVYANAHHANDDSAEWRKPNPGMFLQAAADMNLDLSSSLMVGDKWVDLEAANRAGVGHLAHVLTGHGSSERAKVVESFPRALLIDSLADLRLELFFPARISNTGNNR